jgi:hypothetical protein
MLGNILMYKLTSSEKREKNSQLKYDLSYKRMCIEYVMVIVRADQSQSLNSLLMAAIPCSYDKTRRKQVILTYMSR